MKHYYRYSAYDYSRGASLFVSLSTEPRRRLFGEVRTGGEMVLSAFGEEILSSIHFTFQTTRGLRLFGHCVLPDHVHFRIYLEPGFDSAMAQTYLNRAVGRFKSFTTHLYQTKHGGRGVLWQEGYHDWLCMSREMIDAVERYISYNALKWWMRHGEGRALLAMEEPLKSPRLGLDEYWRGVGAVGLLNGERTMVSLRVSRRCSPRDVEDLVSRLSAKAGELVVISGFISPGERAVLSALLQRSESEVIKVSPYALAHDFAPPVSLMPAIGEGRCAVIAKGNSPEEISRAACLDLNARILEIADRAAYVLPGEVRWLK